MTPITPPSPGLTAIAAAALVLAVGARASRWVSHWAIPPTRRTGPVGPGRRRLGRWLLRAGGAAAIGGLMLAEPATVVGIACTVTLVALTRRQLTERRRSEAVRRALPDALDVLVLGVRAGLTPRQAVAELASVGPEPVRPAFALVEHRTDRGQPFAEALRALPEVIGHDATAVSDVIATNDRYGLPLGPALDQISSEARDARRRFDQADARKLPVRLSFPLVTCTLPSFVLLAIAPAVIASLSSLGGTAW